RGAVRTRPRAGGAGRRRRGAPRLGTSGHRPRRQRVRAARAPAPRHPPVSPSRRARLGVWVAGIGRALPVASSARAQEPPPAVDVTVVGTADDLERARGLVPRLSAGGARWLRVDKLDPVDVLRDRREGDGAAVRVWVDLTSATRARLYFATRSERFL